MTVKNIEEKNTRNGVTFFTGVILYKNDTLDFMFDLNNKQLFIFEWQRIPADISADIWRLMCKLLHAGLGVEELELEV